MSDKKKLIEKALEKLREKNPGIDIGFNNVRELTAIPTPFVTLNNLNAGGIPRGKFGAIAGPAQTAKSTLLAQIIGYNHQIDPNFMAMWTDAEASIDKEWMQTLGVDLDRLIIQNYDEDRKYMEAMFDDSLKIIETRGIDMWVIDSISALLPKGDAEDSKGDTRSLSEANMMNLQRKLGDFFRRAVITISPKKDWQGCACVFIGQIYTVPTATGGLDEVRGGNAFKHWVHWRWKTRRGNKDEGPAEVAVRFPDGNSGKIRPGWAQHIKQDKSKVNAKEGHEIILQFVHGRGLDSVNSAITALIGNEVISRNGAFYSHPLLPDGKVRGRDALIEILRNDNSLREQLVAEMDKILAQKYVSTGLEGSEVKEITEE